MCEMGSRIVSIFCIFRRILHQREDEKLFTIFRKFSSHLRVLDENNRSERSSKIRVKSPRDGDALVVRPHNAFLFALTRAALVSRRKNSPRKAAIRGGL